jgi:hypothetical protein
MSIVPLPGARPAVAAIHGLFPVFDAAGAGIVHAAASGSPNEPWAVTRVADLPFVHRLEIVPVGGEPWAVAATLCGGKAFRDDGTQPGAVYAGPLPRDPSDPWHLKPVLQGITKNHGLHVMRTDGRLTVLVAGGEGLFALRVPATAEERWPIELRLSHEVSDVFAADLDGDGVAEIATIEPFHGDTLSVYKRSAGAWRRVYGTGLAFGHVVWAGRLLGEPALLAGSRGGEKELMLLRATAAAPFRLSATVVDRGIGPAQVAVLEDPHGARILSANHAADEIALYTLSRE